MPDVVIYYNQQCSNSRRGLEDLRSRPVEVEVVEYLKDQLDADALRDLVERLEDPVADLVRHDQRFKDLGLDPAAYTEPDAVVALLTEHPELMQRPVVVVDGRARIARPPEDVLAELLD